MTSASNELKASTDGQGGGEAGDTYFEEAVAEELRWLRVRHEAKQRFNRNASGDEPVRKHLRDRLLQVGDLSKLPPVEPLIQGLLYRDTLAQVAGPAGCYKTFAAVAFSCAVAAAKSFGSFWVPTPGTVVYVLAEGASGIQARILAWCEVWGVDPAELADRLLVLPLPIQLGDRMDVSQAAEMVRETNADLLVLDTRARCTVGMEENSATQQGLAIEAAETIRRAAGCTLLGIHHSPRSGTAGRGSNAWDGAVWSDLRMDRDGQQATIHCAKHKDVESGCTHHFSLVRHTVSADLMPHVPELLRRTLVLSARAPEDEPLTVNSQRVVAEIIWNCALSDGLTRPQLVELAKEAGVGKTAAYNALKSLFDQGYVRNIGTEKHPRYVAGERQP